VPLILPAKRTSLNKVPSFVVSTSTGLHARCQLASGRQWCWPVLWINLYAVFRKELNLLGKSQKLKRFSVLIFQRFQSI
jgi:hypothetical protein